MDYPDEWANGYHVMLDSEELVTVRWDQVVTSKATYRSGWQNFPNLKLGRLYGQKGIEAHGIDVKDGSHCLIELVRALV